jgi:metal-responsive CopG/Arc/MetJ family transcriptional regulator
MGDQTERKQVSVRIPLRLKAELEFEADERGASRSEYVREILRDRHRADELQERLDARDDRIDELERQLARRSEVESKLDDLVKREQEPDPPFWIRWSRWLRRDDD